MNGGDDPVAVKRRVQVAEDILKAVGAPKAQRNERSALTLLGLLDLAPLTPWTDAGAPLRGVTELMAWMAEHYGKQYAPNTRVFVTTFLDRATMREYLPEIAWETEVWVADAPEHLIHFNGERFLGPYESNAAGRGGESDEVLP